MAIIAEKKAGEKVLAPQGNHVARCYSMIHVGTIPTEYMGETKIMNKVRISWELPNETHVFNEEKGAEPFVITKEYTLSMNEKATLRKDLESWRGKAFTEDQANSFDITKLLSIPAMVNVIHKESKNGNTYAIVSSITPMPKGIQCPEQININFEFNFDSEFESFGSLPEWLREKIALSEEYKGKVGVLPQQEQSSDDVSSGVENQDDDLPF